MTKFEELSQSKTKLADLLYDISNRCKDFECSVCPLGEYDCHYSGILDFLNKNVND